MFSYYTISKSHDHSRNPFDNFRQWLCEMVTPSGERLLKPGQVLHSHKRINIGCSSTTQ